MYQISEAYRAKMLDQIQTHRLTGVLDDTITFTGDDVVGVSSNFQASDKKVNIGGVYTSSLKLTFLKDFLDRGSYFRKKITISDGLIVGHENDEPVWEDIPVGTFYITEAVWTAGKMVNITAYDCLSLMDIQCSLDTSFGTIYNYCKYIERMTGAEFGMTQEECALLPNGTESVAPYIDNDINTYRDLLSYIAAFAGGFAYAGKDGKFYIKNFKSTPDLTIPKNRRFSKAKYSDYTTLYDTLSYTDLRTGQENRVGSGEWTEIRLGANPFIQYGSITTRLQRLANILNACVPMKYQPYNVSLLPAFIALDLADVVSFSDDYTSEISTGAVMSLTWTYNKSVQIQCFGENPNFTAVQTQANKRISSVAQSSSNNELTYYNYANVDAFTFGSNREVPVAQFRFVAAQLTTVKIFHEFIFDMNVDINNNNSYEIHYYLDGDLIAYKPYESVNALSTEENPIDVSICRDFFYVLRDIAPNVFHTWEVRIITHGVISTTVDVDHCHITLEGQKLYGESTFDGFIAVEDNLDLYDFGYPALSDFTDSAEVKLDVQNDYLLTESGDYINTESGDRLIL